MSRDVPPIHDASLVFVRDGRWVRFRPGPLVEEPAADLAAPARAASLGLATDSLGRADEPEGPLALAAQFAMLDRGGRLTAHSRLLRAPVDVPAEALEALLAFDRPHAFAEVATRLDPEAARWIGWAIEHGFLVRPAAPVQEVSAPQISVASAHRPEVAEPTAADDRLPVYLVTAPNTTYFPLALGMIRAYAERLDGGRLLRTIRFVPFVTEGPMAVAKAFMQNGPGVWLMSDYMWCLDANLAASTLIKRLSGKNVVVHGGPSAPKYPDASEAFLQDHQDVDVIVRGEGERSAVELLDALGRAHAARHPLLSPGVLEDVAGLVFATERRGARRVIRTADRPRIADLDELPSPYLNGTFDDLAPGMMAGAIETNRGCPYGCTFCDWGSATLQKIRKFDAERVRAEIAWFSEHRVPILWIADANFGIFEEDVAIAKLVAEHHERTGFPREFVVNYAKNATLRVAEIVRILTRAGMTTQGIISIQTRDAPTLATVRRSNIKTKRYEELAQVFREEGLPLTVELMLGLPGSTVASLKADLQHYFDEGTPVRVYDTVVLPNSPMADPAYMAEHGIAVDERGYILRTNSYTAADLDRMESIARLYRSAVDCAVLRHVLAYLQWDHGVPALEVIDALGEVIRRDPDRYPHATFFHGQFRTHGRMRGGWGALYREIERFVQERFAIAHSTALSTIFLANELVMPEEGRTLPATYQLDHDVVAYVRERGARPLETYGPGPLTVSDPEGITARLRTAARPAEFMQSFWELTSPLERVRAKVHFMSTLGAA